MNSIKHFQDFNFFNLLLFCDSYIKMESTGGFCLYLFWGIAAVANPIVIKINNHILSEFYFILFFFLKHEKPNSMAFPFWIEDFNLCATNWNSIDKRVPTPTLLMSQFGKNFLTFYLLKKLTESCLDKSSRYLFPSVETASISIN